MPVPSSVTFKGGRASHGNSLSHRAPGSIGQRQTPGRVFPGKPMSGQLGNKVRTQQNLEVVRVDAEKNLLLVKGAVPGAKGSDVMIRPSVKAQKKQRDSRDENERDEQRGRQVQVGD